MISFLRRPSSLRFLTYALALASQRMRTITMRWMAAFKRRSPPQFRRCRTVLPEEAGMGQVPARAANAASSRILLRCDQHPQNGGGRNASIAGQIKQRRRDTGSQCGGFTGITHEILIQRQHQFREPDRFSALHAGRGALLVHAAPGRG